MIRKRKSFTLLKLLWPILEDSSTRKPTSALNSPQTAEGREDLSKPGFVSSLSLILSLLILSLLNE